MNFKKLAALYYMIFLTLASGAETVEREPQPFSVMESRIQQW